MKNKIAHHNLNSSSAPMDARKVLCERLVRSTLDIWIARDITIGRYKVDFVCYRNRLVIDVYNKPDDDPKQWEDKKKYLEKKGFKVLRFWSTNIFLYTEEIYAQIKNSLPPNHMPKKEFHV